MYVQVPAIAAFKVLPLVPIDHKAGFNPNVLLDSSMAKLPLEIGAMQLRLCSG